ncbi:MAG: GLUG motif-containing protein, partial [Oscillospiraceae bacterium]
GDLDLTRCSNSGVVTAAQGSAGGLVGYASQKATLLNCHNTGNVTGPASNGGLVGETYSNSKAITLTNCSSTGNVTMSGTNSSEDSGGLVGYLHANTVVLTRCFAQGNVSGGARRSAGGLVGYLSVPDGGTGTVTACYATGDVSNAGDNTGGLVGQTSGTITVRGCYATGAVEGTYTINPRAGGLVGASSSGTLTLTECAALNPSVKTPRGPTGRLVGSQSNTTITNCYGRADMVVTMTVDYDPVNKTVDDGDPGAISAGIHGANLTATLPASTNPNLNAILADFSAHWNGGTSTVLPTLQNLSGGVTQTPVLKATTGGSETPLTGIALDPAGNITLTIGGTKTVTVKPLPDGAVLPPVSATSNVTGIATVAAGGNTVTVTGVGGGSTQITVTAGEKTANLNVNVTGAAATEKTPTPVFENGYNLGMGYDNFYLTNDYASKTNTKNTTYKLYAAATGDTVSGITVKPSDYGGFQVGGVSVSTDCYVTATAPGFLESERALLRLLAPYKPTDGATVEGGQVKIKTPAQLRD